MATDDPHYPRDSGAPTPPPGIGAVSGLQPPPALLVATGAVSVQVGAAIATHLFPRVGPGGAVTLRLVFAAIALGAFAARRGRVRWAEATRSDWGVAVAFGLVLAGMNLAFYEAIARVPLGVAVTVEFAGPLAVTVGGSRKKLDLAWALFAGVGVFLLAGGGLIGGRHLDVAGVGLALIAGGCWAAYILLSAETGRRFGGTSGLVVAMAVGALAVLPIGVAEAGSSLLEPVALALGALVAVLSSAMPYSFELIALRRVTPRAFGILLSMEPAIAALVGLALLGQRLALREIGALVLVVVANVGSSWFDARSATAPV